MLKCFQSPDMFDSWDSEPASLQHRAVHHHHDQHAVHDLGPHGHLSHDPDLLFLTWTWGSVRCRTTPWRWLSCPAGRRMLSAWNWTQWLLFWKPITKVITANQNSKKAFKFNHFQLYHVVSVVFSNYYWEVSLETSPGGGCVIQWLNKTEVRI